MILRALDARFVRFVLVGGFGFIVDAGALLLLISAGTGPFVGRIISILLAMFITWRLNRAFTFEASQGSQVSEAGRYFSVATGVAALNYLLYAGLLLLVPACPPLVATAAATTVCTFISFTGYGRIAFRAD